MTAMTLSTSRIAQLIEASGISIQHLSFELLRSLKQPSQTTLFFQAFIMDLLWSFDECWMEEESGAGEQYSSVSQEGLTELYVLRWEIQKLLNRVNRQGQDIVIRNIYLNKPDIIIIELTAYENIQVGEQIEIRDRIRVTRKKIF